MTPPYPQPLPLLGASAVLLLLFTAVASADGLYLHLWRYRLHRRPASIHEHRLHTANAVLFPPLCFLLYCVQPAGLWLWLATALTLASLALEVIDVRCEHQSRADMGGLGRDEYLMHFLMSALRSAAVVPLLVSAPGEAWGPDRTALTARPLWLLLVGAAVAVPAVGAALVHLVLCLPARPAKLP
jgi:hypothetical protein